MNGRATDAQFAQNPLPLLRAMGASMAELHQRSAADVEPGTPQDLAAARHTLIRRAEAPAPYDRLAIEQIESLLERRPPAAEPVLTHGAPVVTAAKVVAGSVRWSDGGAAGADPAERDLAIVLRSIAETFTSEATATFLEAYEAGGGRLPDGRLLDWYALVAALR